MHNEDAHQLDEYLVAHVREALAADERVAQLDVALQVQGDHLLLTGCVQTVERRDAIEAIVRPLVIGHRVINEIEVRNLGGESSDTLSPSAIRVAAVGDVHFGTDSHGQLREHMKTLSDDADLLLIAGDLTRHGTHEEAAALAAELTECTIPVVVVLGNHDYHNGEEALITKTLESAGIVVLEGSSTTLSIRGISIGIAGTKGFGGGFIGACASEFGESLQKAFVAHTRELAGNLRSALTDLDTDIRLALLHFSPVADTLRGERLEIYPFLGSYLLAESIDAAGCDMVFHGHAHAGSPSGVTAGGIAVRNVAQPVIGHAYEIFHVEPGKVFAGVTAIDVAAHAS